MPENPCLSLDQQIIGDVYTSTEVMDNLTILCDEFGSRFGGTPGEKQAADFMKETLEGYGLSNVHLEPISYEGWQRGEVTFAVTSPTTEEIDCMTLPHSPPANISGQIIDLGDGAPEDFDRLADDIEGKIVMVTSEAYPGSGRRWIHRNEKYGRSLLAGAIGFIFVNHYPGYGPATGGIGENGAGHIPGIALSYENGMYLRRMIQRHGDVTVRLISLDVIKPMISWNVIADLPGKKDPDQIVMIGCHYDGHDIAQGAADPASGTVAVMEAARVLAKYAPDLPITIRFALWGVEEIGLLGSKQYAAAHDDALDTLRFYLNMDMAGAIDPKDVELNEWPDLAPIFKAWAKEMALPFQVGQSVHAHSDHYPFLMAGVPTGGIGRLRKGRSGRGYGHTRYDTLDKVEIRGLREAAVLAARLALRIASRETWPVQRRSRKDVDAVLDGPDMQEEAAIFNKIHAFYAEKRERTE